MGVSVALGCADVDAPSGGWVKRSSAGEALFGCSDRLQTWRLRCRGDQWIGVRHNCTSRGTFNFSEQFYSSPSDRERNTHTHTHPFSGPFSGTTRVSRYQKGKTNLDFTEARDSECQWHQPGHMQVCISLQTDNHASTPPLKFFRGLMPFLPPNQQRQSPERKKNKKNDIQ